MTLGLRHQEHPEFLERQLVGQVLSTLPGEVLERFSEASGFPALASRRFDLRLADRAARRMGLPECARIAAKSGPIRDLMIRDGAVRSLIISVGAACHHARLSLVVDRADLAVIETGLGVSVDALLRQAEGTSRAAGKSVRSSGTDGAPQDLIDAVMRDGANCWRCWLGTRETELARVLWAVTPVELRDLTRAVPVGGDRERREKAQMVGATLARLDHEYGESFS